MDYSSYNVNILINNLQSRVSSLTQENEHLRRELQLWQKYGNVLEKIKHNNESIIASLNAHHLSHNNYHDSYGDTERELIQEYVHIKQLLFPNNLNVNLNVTQINTNINTNIGTELSVNNNCDNRSLHSNDGNQNILNQKDLIIDETNYDESNFDISNNVNNQIAKRKSQTFNSMTLSSPDGPKKYNCTWNGCSYGTNLSGNFRKHYRIHTGEKPYKCDWEGCDYRCSDPKTMKDHKRNIHTKEKNFHCEYPGCGRVFGRKYDLNVHFDRTHMDPNERPHKCDWPGCECAFVLPKELKFHLSQHTGERPFKCDVEGCDATFRWEHVLKRHRNEYHQKNKVKIACDYEGCKSKFFREKDLDIHKKREHLGLLPPRNRKRSNVISGKVKAKKNKSKNLKKRSKVSVSTDSESDDIEYDNDSDSNFISKKKSIVSLPTKVQKNISRKILFKTQNKKLKSIKSQKIKISVKKPKNEDKELANEEKNGDDKLIIYL